MKYIVHAHITVSCWTEVVARNHAAALEIAAHRPVADHHIDRGNDIGGCWHFDNDGSPHNLRIEGEA